MRHERLRTKFTLVMALVAAALIGAPHVEARAPHAQMEVGIRCQQEYQNNWQLDVGNSDVWRRCGNFNSQIGQTDNVRFYFNLHGAKAPLEKTSDGCGLGCGGADSVDFLYINMQHDRVQGSASQKWAKSLPKARASGRSGCLLRFQLRSLCLVHWGVQINF